MKGDMLFLQRFAREDQAVRGVVVDDHAAVAVEDPASRRGHWKRLDLIALRHLVVDLFVPHLQIPVAGEQEDEDADGEVLNEDNFGNGEFGVVPHQGRDLGVIGLRSAGIWVIRSQAA